MIKTIVIGYLIVSFSACTVYVLLALRGSKPVGSTTRRASLRGGGSSGSLGVAHHASSSAPTSARILPFTRPGQPASSTRDDGAGIFVERLGDG